MLSAEEALRSTCSCTWLGQVIVITNGVGKPINTWIPGEYPGRKQPPPPPAHRGLLHALQTRWLLPPLNLDGLGMCQKEGNGRTLITVPLM